MTDRPSFVLVFLAAAAAWSCGDSAAAPGSPASAAVGGADAGSGGRGPTGGSSPTTAGFGGVAAGGTAGAFSAGSGGGGNASVAGSPGGAGAAGGGGGASASGEAGAGASAGGAAGAAQGGGGASGGGGAPGGGGTAPLLPVTVFLAGDSTVSTYTDTASPGDQAGWGQMLHEHLSPLATVDNRAIGGRTSRRFIEEGRLDEISEDLGAGDFLLVQFGTNDSNKTATYTLGGQTIPYYLDPSTDFKTYLKRYIDAARARQANPVLVTPPPRNSAYCTGGNGTGAYAQAMRELGAAEQVAVADLNARAVTYLKAICPSPTPEDFFLLKADGTVDGTHFQENGARKLASFVTQGLADTPSALARYAK